MPKVLVLYYSSYGHIETMAQAVAEGARSAGASVDIKRVPETVPEDIAKGAYFKLDQAAPVATVAELPEYDAIIVGTPTRFGRMPAQMASFLDQAGGLWARGALNGKVGGAFTSTATQHGGQELTLFSVITNLMHFGMVIVGLPYNMDGTEGASARHARVWAGKLAKRIDPIPVRLVDERLSTVTAHAQLSASGRNSRHHRSVVDQAAAVVILETALEIERRTGREPGELVPAERSA